MRNELLEILQNTSAMDLRMYYLPIREVCTAYDEGKYEIVNRYVTVILEFYNQDVTNIKYNSGIANFNSPIKYTFSYVTSEEKYMIDQLLEKDKSNHFIAEKDKDILSNMKAG